MTDVATLQRQLAEHEADLLRIAQEIKRMVPSGCDPNALILSAFNRTGGASAEVGRAHRDFTQAIRGS